MVHKINGLTLLDCFGKMEEEAVSDSKTYHKLSKIKNDSRLYDPITVNVKYNKTFIVFLKKKL